MRLPPAGTCDGDVQAQQTTFLVERRGLTYEDGQPEPEWIEPITPPASQPRAKVAVAQY